MTVYSKAKTDRIRRAQREQARFSRWKRDRRAYETERAKTAPVRVAVSQIRFLVDRMHVGTSNLAVLRAIRKRILPTVDRETRKAIYRAAVRIHAENRNLYRAVTRGF